MSETEGYDKKVRDLVKRFLSGGTEGTYVGFSIDHVYDAGPPPWSVTFLRRGEDCLARREEDMKKITISHFMPENLQDIVSAHMPKEWICVLDVLDDWEKQLRPIKVEDIGEHKIVIHIPEIDNQEIDNAVNEKIRPFFEDLGGGCTWFGFGGSWRYQGKKHIDKGHHFWCILDKDLYNNNSGFKRHFESFLDEIGFLLKQESMYFEIDGKAKLLYVRRRDSRYDDMSAQLASPED